MARARNIKPGFFKNDTLVELPFEHRLLFVGLWTLADRDGKLEDRPKKIKMEIFPADNVDVEQGLSLLAENGFIERYEAEGVKVIMVCNFSRHQSPHHTEKASTLPSNNGEATVNERKQDGGNPPDSLIPDSLIPDSNQAAVADGKPSRPTTAKEQIFARGLPLLTTAGLVEKQARTLLGSFCRDFPEESILAAIQACADEQVLEPVGYMQRVLRSSAPKRQPREPTQTQKNNDWMKNLWSDPQPEMRDMGTFDASTGQPV
ncbi:hypothetical protein CEY09_30415 [Achromobacter marplatensis]|uniref:Phage replication protein n=1 Tax=Achromobacter marplatensis TaxID=470868 RepID=A0ABX9FUV0_9BURK|nr:hypothetical protein [Achromobacter marplatensis]OWT55304.1 hypothetical protein CEY09_30415 [Achromobacter marplatensis]RBP10644.1 hypothetical protein DFP87_1257 [Achromobacter marplatensis]CAB3712877.1 hypothetical protein LMG26219_06028 [Achromobacter marplatensis]